MRKNLTEKIKNISLRERQTILFSALIAAGIALILAAVFFLMPREKFSVYTNPSAGVSIRYPDSWELRDTDLGMPDVVVVFVSPKENELDVFQENVSVIIQDLSSDPMTLGQYTKRAVAQILGVFKDSVEMVESKSVKLAGLPGYKFLYRGKDPSDPSILKFVHFWTIKNDKAYQITYGSLGPSFEKRLGAVNAMVRSFRIK
ncbi:MAG: PsbP-related protein [Candidatus Omnitrophota bacterium]